MTIDERIFYAQHGLDIEKARQAKEVGVEIIKTEETKEGGIKYFNINASNSEVERNPDIVRLRADVGILEYVKPKTGHWIMTGEYYTGAYDSIDYVECSCCHEYSLEEGNYCPNCGAKMVESEG